MGNLLSGQMENYLDPMVNRYLGPMVSCLGLEERLWSDPMENSYQLMDDLS